jgi:hypothetical protein
MKAGRRPGRVESYWVLPGQFLAGEYPAAAGIGSDAQRLEELLELGIDSFFDLTEPHELPSYLPLLSQLAERKKVSITYQRFPILDFGLPQRADMLSTLDALDTALSAERKVYLHCWGGVGRTGMTVGCFLVRHGSSGPQALHQIAEWWQDMPKRRFHVRSPETDAQVQYVLDWNEATHPSQP